MAATSGHGNPKWTRDEVILALDLYFQLDGKVPSSADHRIVDLSQLLRRLPYHEIAAKKPSFRNPDGVAFKLQNLRQIATGKGLGNVAQMDRDVWRDFSDKREKLREIANTLRQSISTANQINETPIEYDVFVEGLIITESHSRRERDPNLRRKLLASRASRGALRCDLCDQDSSHIRPEIADSIFESHHLVPLSQSGLVKTKLSDLALLCACCHRAVHRMIAINKNWISIEEAREMLLVKA